MLQRRNTLVRSLRPRHTAVVALAAAGLAACSAERVTAPGGAAPSGAPNAATWGTTATAAMSPYASLSMSSATFESFRSSWRTGPSDQFAGTTMPKPMACSGQSVVRGQASVGTGGGKIYAGTHYFSVPAGALSAPTTITVTFTKSASGVSADLWPHGIRFAKPTEVKFDLSGCTVPSGSTLDVYYVDDRGRVLQVMPSTSASGATRALTDHFSGFIVGWGVRAAY